MHQIRSGNILIVEDDTESLNVLLELLSTSGYRVFVATDGQSAIDKALPLNPDLILLDVMMPLIDGFETCALLKANENLKDIPVIFITSLSDTVNKIKGFEVGGIDYITKPYQNEEVISRINTHLENRKLQRELQESEARYSTTLSSIGDGVIATDLQGKITYMNYVAEQLTGWTYEEAAKRYSSEIFKIIHEQTRLEADNPVEAVIDNKSIMTLPNQMILVKKNSQEIPIDDSIAPIKGRDGNVIGVVLVFRDVSLRRQAEEVLKRDKEEIERLVALRTKELTEAQAKLERAKRLSDIGTLAATVAHELRNPLASINLAVHNVRRKANNQEIEKHLATICKKVTESDQIINNLLYYSQIKQPHFERVVISDLIEECIENIHAPLKIGVRIERELDSIKNVPIEADQRQLCEIFSNILNNAIDAVSDSEGIIRITGAHSAICIDICVSDNGYGIRKDDLERVFDPFFTTKTKGTGLGLSVCKQIVSLHGGSIEILSKQGTGTSVTICLPKKDRLSSSPIN